MKCRVVPWGRLLPMMATGIVFAHGDLHDRISQITAEIHDSPSAGLFFHRGCLRPEHGEASDALADFGETNRLAPGAFETDPLRAEGLIQLGKYPQALETLNRHLEHHPSASRCLVLRARVYAQMGEPAAAIRDYQKSLALTPNPEPDLMLEISREFAQNNRTGEALEVLDQGVSLLGPLPSLVLPAVEMELKKSNWDGALRRIGIMQAAAPRPEPWMARRASILAQAGRIAESRAAWQSLLDHISALPSAERGSHAMSTRAREAREALASLTSTPVSRLVP